MGTLAFAANFRDLFHTVYVYTGTLDVASLADGVGATSSLTVPGVKLGDMVLGRSLSVSLQGITLSADVTADNTVQLRFQNESGGTLDLASATIRVLVARPSASFFN